MGTLVAQGEGEKRLLRDCINEDGSDFHVFVMILNMCK